MNVCGVCMYVLSMHVSMCVCFHVHVCMCEWVMLHVYIQADSSSYQQ